MTRRRTQPTLRPRTLPRTHNLRSVAFNIFQYGIAVSRDADRARAASFCLHRWCCAAACGKFIALIASFSEAGQVVLPPRESLLVDARAAAGGGGVRGRVGQHTSHVTHTEGCPLSFDTQDGT